MFGFLKNLVIKQDGPKKTSAPPAAKTPSTRGSPGALAPASPSPAAGLSISPGGASAIDGGETVEFPLKAILSKANEPLKSQVSRAAANAIVPISLAWLKESL